MGDLSGKQLIDRIEKIIGNRTDTSRTNDILVWLNLAQTRIARAHPWRELLGEHEEVAASEKVTLTRAGFPASDILSVHVHYQDRTTRMRQVPYRQYTFIAQKRFGTGGPDSGAIRRRPRLYAVLEDSDEVFLYLWPIPETGVTTTLTIFYRRTPTSLTDGATTSLLQRKDDMLIALAAHIGFHELGMRTDAGQYFAQYTDMLNDAKMQDLERSDRLTTNLGIEESANDVLSGDPWSDPFIRRIS